MSSDISVRPAGDVLAPQTCGTCEHWQEAEAGLGECALGWEAHDGLWSELRGKRWGRATMGHGGLPLPLTSPGCRCLAEVAGQAGYALKAGAA